jgi:hypothetical protein
MRVRLQELQAAGNTWQTRISPRASRLAKCRGKAGPPSNGSHVLTKGANLMNGRMGIVLSILAVTLLYLSCGRQNERAEAQTPAKVQQWEYYVVSLPTRYYGEPNEDEKKSNKAHQEMLDKLGAEGWELCQGNWAGNGLCLFKRLKR